MTTEFATPPPPSEPGLRTLRSLAAAFVSASLLVACGGGGGGGTPPPATPPPAATAAFTQQNYLDALWLAVTALDRVHTAAVVIDDSFEVALLVNDVPGTYPCANGGTVLFARTGNNRSFTPSECRIVDLGETTIYRSGTLSSPDAQTATTGTFIYISSANFQLTNAVIDFTSPDPTYSRSGNESFSGSVLVTGTATTVTGSGTLAVTRNGRADTYTSINVTGPQGIQVAIEAGTFQLSSPRFPTSFGVTYSSATESGTLTAPDGSRLVVGPVPGSTTMLRFTAFDSRGTQTFTADVAYAGADSLSARTRVLQ